LTARAGTISAQKSPVVSRVFTARGSRTNLTVNKSPVSRILTARAIDEANQTNIVRPIKPVSKHNIKAKVDTNNRPLKKKKKVAKKEIIEAKENMTITEYHLDSGLLPKDYKPFSD
jgi:hypothetical protein